MTMHGSWTEAFIPGTLGYALVAMAFLLATALLEAIGALRSVQMLVQRTEWATGATMVATLGAATFAFFAFAEHAAPRVFRRDWRGSLLTDAQLWLSLAGVTLTGLSLVGAGIVHGSLMRDGEAPEVVSGTLLLFRLVAAGGLGMVALGGVCAVLTLFLIYTTARRAEYVVSDAVAASG
jgi:cbb3-type cytochrome oxidase subunit 1